MLRSLRDRTDPADDGISVLEVVFAAAILLLGLTAMLGMLMTSTSMSARARAQGLAVKTATQFIELVRAENYSALNQTRLNELADASSGTVGGMSTSVTTSMTPHFEASQVTPTVPAYQAVKVLVVVSGPGFKSFRFRTGTYVREWQRSAAASRTAPTVRFDDATPPAGTPRRPIWGTNVHVGAVGTSNMSGVVLTTVNVKLGNSFLATATPDAETGSCAADWDVSALPEGRVLTIFAETWDTLNQADTNFRDFIIDNLKPDAPSAVTLTSITGNNTASWAWPVVWDGESVVPDYVVTLSKKDLSGAWIGAVQAPVTAPSASLSTAGFSQYLPSVVARGPRAVTGQTVDWVSPAKAGPVLTTRPNFTAMNVAVTQANGSGKAFYFTANKLTLTEPTFPVTSTKYKWEYKIDTDPWKLFVSATAPNINPSNSNTVVFPQVKAPVNGTKASLSFRCTAIVAIGAVETSHNSPIMTVVNPAGGSTYALANLTPDWTLPW